MELPIVQKLKDELAVLKHEMNHDLPIQLEEAIAHGDLKENAEYHAAKERQGMVRARIGQIQERISALSVYTMASIPEGVVGYGSTVTVEDIDEGGEVVYRVVFPEEADVNAGLISLSSPIGQAFIRKGVGDEVAAHTPNGVRHFEIIALKTLHDAEREKDE